MEHCVIKGKLCSKCCEVQAVPKGFDMTGMPEAKIFTQVADWFADLVNPHAFERMEGLADWYMCKNFDGSGCTDYENRPPMCRGYPHYGRTEEEFRGDDDFINRRNYTDDCTYFIELE